MSLTALPTASAHEAVVISTRRRDHGPVPPLAPRLLVEFVGAFFLVLTVCTATSPKTGVGTAAPLAIGLVLAAMVFAGGHISGGHYNPAVSFAVFVRGKLTLIELLAYAGIQFGAGAAGGVLARWLVGSGHPRPSESAGKIMVAELLFTFALAYVVLNVATAKATEGNSYFGLAIGFTVAAGAAAVGGVSGGAFNPAVALGDCLLGTVMWSSYWIYVVAGVAGGVVAAVVFRYVQPDEWRTSTARDASRADG